MTEGGIIQLPQWLKSPVGQVLLEWEQRHLDHAVADLFGFHALQLGLPELDALHANRMPHRWLAVESAEEREVPHGGGESEFDPAGADSGEGAARRVLVVPPPTLRCHFDALPFAAGTLDLVVLPHALELARDPHLALREVERV
ncbi:MAG: methyltransferase domain-containing protein, partial [Caldimonas sp.]